MSLRGEQAEQAAVVDWMELHSIAFFHVPNQRDFARAARNMHAYLAVQKRIGWRPGVPDLLVIDRPPRFPSAPGAAIEMKYGKGKASLEQDEWLEKLECAGWKTDVCWTWTQAVEFLQSLGYGR